MTETPHLFLRNECLRFTPFAASRNPGGPPRPVGPSQHRSSPHHPLTPFDEVLRPESRAPTSRNSTEVSITKCETLTTREVQAHLVEEATRPIEPVSPAELCTARNALERNWPPRSESRTWVGLVTTRCGWSRLPSRRAPNSWSGRRGRTCCRPRRVGCGDQGWGRRSPRAQRSWLPRTSLLVGSRRPAWSRSTCTPQRRQHRRYRPDHSVRRDRHLE